MRLFLALGNVSIVKLSQFYIYCGKVKKELVNIPDIRQKFGGSARIIVPKTMVVGKPKERLALVTSLDQEMYDSDEIAEKLDYENQRQ